MSQKTVKIGKGEEKIKAKSKLTKTKKNPKFFKEEKTEESKRILEKDAPTRRNFGKVKDDYEILYRKT